MKPRSHLFRKYAVLFVTLVGGALLASGLLDLYFSYRENKAALVRLQRQEAEAAASRIDQFIRAIEAQIGWTTQAMFVPQASLFDRRSFDSLLKLAPSITEVSYLDAVGREQLRVSRLGMDVVGSQADFSTDPKFLEAKSGKTYFGQVYFREESEPYMTIAMSGKGREAGVTVAEANLKFIWDVVSQIKIGKAGYAYVVDSRGNLIAHPDISLVLKKTFLASLPQVQDAMTDPLKSGEARDQATIARNLQGRQVLTAHAAITPLGWLVFVEQPLAEAFAPLYSSMIRTGILLLAGLGASVVVSLLLARRMVTPIQMLQAGAARIGAGALDQRIQVQTGDELEGLAEQFNSMAAELQESYAGLEKKVEERTRDLTEALEQQTATSEILQVISSSPTDLEGVFTTILRHAAQLCGAAFGVAYRYDGELIHMVAHYNFTAEMLAVNSQVFPARPDTSTATHRAILERQVIHVLDAGDSLRHPTSVIQARTLGYRTLISVPMLRDGSPLGTLTVARREKLPFSEGQIGLLKTFADQAAIAIDNVRLFRELQDRNRDLTEALEQQTATAEILRVISGSPTDIQPVYDAIARKAVELCGASRGSVVRVENQMINLVAHYNFSEEGIRAIPSRYPAPLNEHSMVALAARDGVVVHSPDVMNDPRSRRGSYDAIVNFRAQLSVPLMREGVPIGTINVLRAEVGPFTDRQIELLKTFADQAVIGIENVRLFTELQARNRDLTEALEQQTATSEVLKVISRSTFDLQPVLETLIENAVRLGSAEYGVIYKFDGEILHVAALYGASPELMEYWQRTQFHPGRGSGAGRAVLDRRTIHIPDVLKDPEYTLTGPQKIGHYRALLAVPMLREKSVLGVFVIMRNEVQAFTQKQIELATTFADQAVIAIENVRLFQELQARTRELARSVEELKALGEVSQAVSSTLNLERVLTTIVARAVELSGTTGGVVYEYEEGTQAFHPRVTHQLGDELVEVVRATPIRLGEGAVGRAAATRAPVQVPDILDERDYGLTRLQPILARLGYRSLLAVPLLREERIVGGLVVLRREPGAFSVEVVNLLQTFATHSVLAIENARLFLEVEEKGQQLEIASKHKSQFLANMSHELRTPLNAILGYTELILDNIYGDVSEKVRDVLSRLEKSGRHLLGLINDVLDLSKIEAGQLTLSLSDYSMKEVIQAVFTGVESLATEKKLALKSTVPPELPIGRGDERRISQVLLNLVGNAIKFTEVGEVRVEVSTRNGAFLVAVSDTGPGIAPSNQERIFEEFHQVDSSSTRKKGGTGLGLAIVKRIICMHGGRIWVESSLGKGSTFWFTLPIRVEGQTEAT